MPNHPPSTPEYVLGGWNSQHHGEKDSTKYEEDKRKYDEAKRKHDEKDNKKREEDKKKDKKDKDKKKRKSLPIDAITFKW